MSTELTKAGGSLAIRPDQTDWTPAQSAVLRQTGINEQVTPEELSGFLHLCQRTQLDPFSRQIYLIGRWDSRARRDVYRPQTGIDGYRVIAHRATAEQGGTFGYEDTKWCDSSGNWRDVWLSDDPPVAAKVVVLRNGQRFPAVAKYREYAQTSKDGRTTGLWGKMAANQTAKCAEALALRMAFPHDLAGIYTAEEMAQADNPAAEERHLRTVQPGETDPWATATPGVQSAVAKGRSVPAQQFADLAMEAADRATVQNVYRQAAVADLLHETVKVDSELLELGAYLIARGKQLAPPAQVDDATDVVVDAELVDVSDTSYPEGGLREIAAAAERELRATAAKAGLDNLDEEFQRSYGLAIADAGIQQLKEMTQILGGVAA